MPTVSRELPTQPHLGIPKRQARELLALWRSAAPEAIARIRARIPRFASLDDSALAATTFRLADAQLVIAREYGSAHWTELKQRIAESSSLGRLRAAIHADDCATVVAILRRHPRLLHVPVWSGNWGPPLSHAANLDRLAIVQAVAALGARDLAHAALPCRRSLRPRVRSPLDAAAPRRRGVTRPPRDAPQVSRLAGRAGLAPRAARHRRRVRADVSRAAVGKRRSGGAARLISGAASPSAPAAPEAAASRFGAP